MYRDKTSWLCLGTNNVWTYERFSWEACKTRPKNEIDSIILEGSDGQIHSTLEDVSKYFINFDLLMLFAIFDIHKHFLYNQVEKSKDHLFNKILPNKHAAPSIFNFLKQSVSCGITKNFLSKFFKSLCNCKIS